MHATCRIHRILNLLTLIQVHNLLSEILKTESCFMEVDFNLNTTVTMTTMTTLMYPVLQDPRAKCNVPLLHVNVQVYSLVWACLCLKFYWMFYLEIKSTLIILWSAFIPLKINNAINSIYQLVLISCAILSLSFWPLIPLDYHSEVRKIPISETCLVPRVSDKRLCTCNIKWQVRTMKIFICSVIHQPLVFCRLRPKIPLS
jgi:hypothetical protein